MTQLVNGGSDGWSTVENLRRRRMHLLLLEGVRKCGRLESRRSAIKFLFSIPDEQLNIQPAFHFAWRGMKRCSHLVFKGGVSDVHDDQERTAIRTIPIGDNAKTSSIFPI